MVALVCLTLLFSALAILGPVGGNAAVPAWAPIVFAVTLCTLAIVGEIRKGRLP
ncbi:MAG: hypothetical protein ACYDCI_00400 [Candidatus Limnocylindrales bacterium]